MTNSVTFPISLGGDGSTVTDDNNPTTGLGQNGHRLRFVPALSQTVVMAQTSVTSATSAQSYMNSASASAIAAATSATAAANSASALVGTSTSSVVVSTGSKNFNTQAAKFFAGGQFVMAIDSANVNNWLYCQVTSYNVVSGALVLEALAFNGSGTVSSWVLSISGPRGLTGQQGLSVRSGAGAPSGDVGNDGDHYINLTNYDFYGPKTAGAWGSVVFNMKGPAWSGGTLTSALNDAPPVTIATGASMAIGAAASNVVTATGGVTITSFDAIAAGAEREIVFTGAPLITHNATSLILPGGANIQAAAGDVMRVRSLGSGNWRCVSYQKADGQALKGGGAIGDMLVSAAAPTSGTWLKSGIYATLSYSALAALLGPIADRNSARSYDGTTTSGSGYTLYTGLSWGSSQALCTPSRTYLCWFGSSGIVTARDVSFGFSYVSEVNYGTISVSGYDKYGIAADGQGNVVAVFRNGTTTYYAYSTNDGQNWTYGGQLGSNFSVYTFGFVDGYFIAAGDKPSDGFGAVYTSPAGGAPSWTSRTISNNGVVQASNQNRTVPHKQGSDFVTTWSGARLSSSGGINNWTRVGSNPYNNTGYATGQVATNGKTAIIVSNATSYSGREPTFTWCRDITQYPALFEVFYPPRGNFSSNPTVNGVLYAYGYYWGTIADTSGNWLFRINANDPTDVSFFNGDGQIGNSNLLLGDGFVGIYSSGPNTIGWIDLFSYNPATQFFVPPTRGVPAGAEAYMKAL